MSHDFRCLSCALSRMFLMSYVSHGAGALVTRNVREKVHDCQTLLWDSLLTYVCFKIFFTEVPEVPPPYDFRCNSLLKYFNFAHCCQVIRYSSISNESTWRTSSSSVKIIWSNKETLNVKFGKEINLISGFHIRLQSSSSCFTIYTNKIIIWYCKDISRNVFSQPYFRNSENIPLFLDNKVS